VANPYGAILSTALLLRHSLSRDDLAVALETAVDDCIDAGALSPDLGGAMGTAAIGAAVRTQVLARLAAAGALR
jgi:3-isopropylmalate dehydrogenase